MKDHIIQEHDEKDTPRILMFGENHPLFTKLLDSYKKRLSAVILSDKISFSSDYKVIRYSVIDQFESVKEDINYAVFLLSSEEDKHFFAKLINKLVQDKTKVSIIINIRKVMLFYDLISKIITYKTMVVLLIGDLYGQATDSATSIVSSFLNEATSTKRIRLTGNDLINIFPIFDEDASSIISQSIFGNYKKNRIFYLFYSHPQTLISAVHLLKRFEPDLEMRIDQPNLSKKTSFIDKAQDSSRDIFEKDLYRKISVKPLYAISSSNRFEETLSKILNISKTPQIRKINNIYNSLRLPNPSLKKAAFQFLPLLIAAFVFIHTILFFLLVILILLTKIQINSSNLKYILPTVKFSKFVLVLTKPTVSLISFLPVLNRGALLDYFNDADQMIDSAIIVFGVYDDFKSIDKAIPLPKLEKTIASINFTYFSYQRTTLTDYKIIPIQNPKIKQLIKVVPLVSSLPEILGYYQDMNYLILFQNDAELRPTGGFIGSVGELAIKNGEVKNLEIRDVYELDGQLKAHIEPPFIVRRHLQPHLYLRDSNFFIDYEKSASNAALIYNLSSGKNVDGVIAVDFSIIRKVLEIVGPVKIVSKNKVIDKNNIQEYLHTIIETDFFPGSTQKKDILVELYENLAGKIDSPKNKSEIIASIPEMVLNKHILFYLLSEPQLSIFRSLGYSSSLADNRISSDTSINDFLAINEANIGINKVNLKISRKVSYELSFERDFINSFASLDLTNQSKTEDYKVYVRFVTPLGSILKSISINGKEQKIIPAVTDFRVYESNNFKAPEGIEVDVDEKDLKITFGFVTTVTSSSEQKIVLVYKNGSNINKASSGDYNLVFLKQPGTESYPLQVKIIKSEYNIKSKSSNFSSQNQSMVYNKKISTDINLSAIYNKK